MSGQKQAQALASTYKSRKVSGIVLAGRHLISRGTVAGNILTLSKEGSYTLKTCGGIARGNYTFQNEKITLYQQFYTSHRNPSNASFAPDTTIYQRQPNGFLFNKFAGHYFKSGTKKRVNMIDESVTEQ